MNTIATANRYRSIWISDIHLGTKGCKAEFLLDFLKHTESDYLYLVGDIIDCWRLRRSWYWTQSHNDVVQKLLRKARKGTKVIYVPGNHDEPLRDYTGMQFGGVTVLDETIHETADGRRLLVMHGDEFDGVVKYARWLAILGDQAYNLLLAVNHWYNLRAAAGLRLLVALRLLKRQVKDAVSYIDDFEEAVADEARRRGVDGVICGHIHKAEIREIDGILYCNDGDWVESCTALVEHADGRLEILEWASLRSFSMLSLATATRLMRIVIVTDAWQPQVNGVVRTLMRTVEELSRWAMRSRSSRPTTSRASPARPIPRSGWRSCPRRRLAQLIDPFSPTPSISRPRGRWAWRRGAIASAWPALHHRLPHPLPGICQGAVGLPLRRRLCGAALLPRAGGRGDGGDREPGTGSGGTRLPQYAALVPGRGYRALPSARQILPRPAAARSISTSAGSRWRRTSRPS